MNIDEVTSHIVEAFATVKLGDGIGLWQAQAIDDYEPEEVQNQKKQKDIKEKWQTISSEELQRCHSSLSFFDADGMRFHLPAFIIASIKDGIDDPVFHLTHLSDYAKSKFSTLNQEQVGAVIYYLTWCLEMPDYAYDKPMIEKALDEYWVNLE